jgi:DNA replication protein DnaC
MTISRLSRPKIEKLTQQHLERMNIGKRYWGASLSSVDEATAHGRVARKYLSQIDLMAARGVGMYLWGDNSRGKTYSACALLKAVYQSGYTTYCVMADQLRSIYIDRSMFDPEMSVVQRVEQVEVLLIEDLGKEYSGKGSGWAELCFENLLRKRTRELKPTFITTNLSPSAFKERYKESAQAICLEGMIACQVRGIDHRKKIQSELQEMVR